MKTLILFLIKFYQRYLSPYKGFVCAYHKYTGRASCSTFGYRVIRRFGIWQGFSLLQNRLDRCANIHRQHQVSSLQKSHTQAGFIDVCCEGCNVTDIGDCNTINISDCNPIDANHCEYSSVDIMEQGCDAIIDANPCFGRRRKKDYDQ